MFGLGFTEIVVLAALSGGMNSTDLMMLVPPADYFQSRQIEVSVDKMMELAAADAKIPKTQIRQLAALRYLTAESAALQKAPKFAAYRQTLEQIAQGKKAQDPTGFAREYAGALLAKLAGTETAPGQAPPLRDAVAWFPADSTIVMAFDQRHLRGTGRAKDHSKLIHEFMKAVPDDIKKQMYAVFEQTGNVRLERIAFAIVENEKDRSFNKVFIRFSGKGNPTWLMEAFKSLAEQDFQTKQIRDVQGTPILVANVPGQSPYFLFVGNTDILAVGYQRAQRNNDDLAKEVLALRDKKQPSALEGSLKKDLAKIPAKAVAMIVGTPFEELKRSFAAITPAPTKISGHVVRDPNGLDVRFEGTMRDADEASTLVKKIGKLRGEGINAIKKAQEMGLVPGAQLGAALIDVLESVQVQNDGDKTQVRMLIPANLIGQIPAFLMPRKAKAP